MSIENPQAGMDPRQECIHERFEQQAQRTPDRIALLDNNRKTTFRELNTSANQLAHFLRQRGVGPEVFVGLCLQRSIEAVVGVLGILKAGGAYVPLDPEYPDQRLTEMIEDAGVSLVLTNGTFKDRLGLKDLQMIYLDLDTEPGIVRQSTANPPLNTTPNNTTYVVYTSGSTGKPKGLVLTHASVMNGLSGVPFDPSRDGEVCSLNTSLSFGFSAARLFLPLMTGVPLLIVAEEQTKDVKELVKTLEQGGATSVAFVTPLFRQILACGPLTTSRLHRLRTIVVGGAPTTPDLIDSSRQALPGAVLLAGYAMSEAGGAVLVSEFDEKSTIVGTVAGRPFPNVKVHVLDDDMREVPTGTAGELYIAAAHLARGYLGRPSLTADRFLPNPFGRLPGERLYRTGDLGQTLPSGAIEVLGRVDHQVKIRGYRVELEEIELALQSHEQVEDCVVDAQSVGGDKRLVAYVVGKTKAPSIAAELREYLRQRLPNYMVPARFVILDGFPKTSTGKVDRHALPRVEPTRPNLDVEYEPPRNSVEASLADMWSSLLGVEPVGVHDNFIELGGDSLVATQILSRIVLGFSVEVPLRIMLERGTVAHLAAEISTQSQPAESPVLIPDATAVRKAAAASLKLQPIPKVARDGELPLSFQVEGQLLLEWLTRLRSNSYRQPTRPAMFDLEGDLDPLALESAINGLIDRHEVIRTSFSPAPHVAAAGDDWEEQARRFPYGASVFTQHVHAKVSITLPVQTLENSPPAERERIAAQSTIELAEQPFDYAVAPLLKTLLLRFAPRSHRLVVVFPKIITDRLSTQILERDLRDVYRSFAEKAPSMLPDLPIQYADFAHWQRQRFRRGAYNKVLSYWMGRLADVTLTTVDDLRLRDAALPGEGATQQETLRLDAVLTKSMRAFCAPKNLTTSMALTGAFSALLHLYSQKPTIGLLCFFANRAHPDTANLIGMFSNTLILAFNFDTGATSEQVFEQARGVVGGAADHQEIPLGLLSRIGRPNDGHGERSSGEPFSALNYIGFDFIAKSAAPTAHRLMMNHIDVPEPQTEMGLKLIAIEEEQGITLQAIYRTEKLSRSSAGQILANLKDILVRMLSSPKESLHEIQRSTFSVSLSSSRSVSQKGI